MKYAQFIPFTEPIRITFVVNMSQDAFLKWYHIRAPGGALRRDEELLSGRKASTKDDAIPPTPQMMYFDTLPYADGRTNVTAVCLDPVIRPAYEFMLIRIFDEFETARRGLFDATRDGEIRRLLPELARYCDDQKNAATQNITPSQLDAFQNYQSTDLAHRQIDSLYASFISDCFTDEEFREILFDLGIPYDHLTGTNLPTRAISLVERIRRHNRFDEFKECLNRRRPQQYEEEVLSQLDN